MTIGTPDHTRGTISISFGSFIGGLGQVNRNLNIHLGSGLGHRLGHLLGDCLRQLLGRLKSLCLGNGVCLELENVVDGETEILGWLRSHDDL